MEGSSSLYPQSSIHYTRWVFLRLLGLVYFTAFASLWVQLSGLIGSRGILPAADFLQAVYAQIGSEAYPLLPTLFWFNTSDTALQLICGGGTLLSLLLVAGFAPGPILLLLWAFYLSLTVAGQDFLAFQWDNLLLETGHNPFPNTPPRYIRAVLYLYHFTDFTTAQSSGVWWQREQRLQYAPVLSLPKK